MLLSWVVAFVYALIYSSAIWFTKYKAKQRLAAHKELRRRNTSKRGLVENQQKISPDQHTIDEENPTNPDTPAQTATATTTAATTAAPKSAKPNRRMSDASVDLSQVHQQLHTSMPYGAPVSDWECFIAILHSVDAGLHLGLLVEMIRDSQGWNLQEQYLMICISFLVWYRVISFLTVYISLPRYSYSKRIQRSAQQNADVDVLQNAEKGANPSGASADPVEKRNSITSTESPSRSCLSYCWLQFFFDFGYVMELAPWLWNWEQSKIILPEFAWFTKMRTLLQSFPFCILMVVSLLAIDNVNQHIHIYFIVSLAVSVLTIVLSLTLYDHRTLNQDPDDPNETRMLLFCNFCYRIFSATARVIILSFLIALFPWYLLFAILFVPIIAFSGPYKLGNFDAEPLNLLYQSLLVFPDYSAPFGKIPDSETYLNNINKLHLCIIILCGAPLIVIFIIVEKIVNKILRIDDDIMSMNKEKYASFRITTYTLCRFVESTIELFIIAAELYSPVFESQLLIKDALLVHALFWISVTFTILAPLPYIKLYDEFVVDNEEDYELWYGVADNVANPGDKSKVESDFIMTDDQYNTDHGFVDVGNAPNAGNGPNGPRSGSGSPPGGGMGGMPNVNSPQHNISSVQTDDGAIDIRGSRQYLRQKQYWIAVHRNKYKELAWVLRSRQHVNLLEYNEQEQLGIIIVGLRHDWNCLELLVRHGGGLRHLVRYAALHGQVEILTFLHNKLHINMGTMLDNADEALLFSAIEGSQAKVVSLLVQFGANLTALSTEGESPTILAAKSGELEILKIFGANGVDLQVTDDQGNTVAHYAAQVFNGKHILSYLSQLYSGNGNNDNNTEEKEQKEASKAKEFNFNYQNKRGATAAYNAAWNGQIDNMEVLKSVGADFTIANNDGNHCLIGAAMNDQPMIINYLLDECKLDVDYCNDCQETALYWSASNGCIGCIEALIEHRVNREKCDKYGITALMVAAEHGEAKAVEVLLEAGANSNHQNQDGETALMKACAEGFIDCVKALIKYKTDHTITDDEGNPALLWCCMTGNMDIFKYLVCDALHLTKEDIENTVNNDKETCIDWIVENKLDLGLEVLQDLGIQVSAYLDDDDDGSGSVGSNGDRSNDGFARDSDGAMD